MHRTKITLGIAMLMLLPFAANAALIASYDFHSGLADSLGNGPDLVDEGGTVGGGLYTFGANQGLILDGGLADTTNYAVEMRIAQTGGFADGWRKLLDFEDLTSDLGLYINPADRVSFWTGATGGGDQLFPFNEFVTIGLTRNGATNEVQAFLNGVLQFSFIDTTNQAVTSIDRLRFFHDDNVTGQGETFSGAVDYIRIFDAPSTRVPEPGTLALFGIGIAGIGLARRRRKN